jgi:hypothetical protein
MEAWTEGSEGAIAQMANVQIPGTAAAADSFNSGLLIRTSINREREGSRLSQRRPGAVIVL